ncbi:MAG TPA: hypothetical protein VHC18_25370, partial [Amycolatopsis sp.]|nr:hypothetical protein [Amycolatopsis sp.]
RKPEAPPETAAETSGGGRRRRPEGEPPPWQASAGSRSTGSHAKPDLGGEPAGRRAKPEEPAEHRTGPEQTGSHAAGRSVSDLLAAHGGTTGAVPRRRRRAED